MFGNGYLLNRITEGRLPNEITVGSEKFHDVLTTGKMKGVDPHGLKVDREQL